MARVRTRIGEGVGSAVSKNSDGISWCQEMERATLISAEMW